MLNNRSSNVPCNFCLGSHRLAFDAVLKANPTANFCKNRNGVGIPLAKYLPGLNHVLFFNGQRSTVRNGVFLQLTAFFIDQNNFGIPCQNDLIARSICHASHAGITNSPRATGLQVRLLNVGRCYSTDMERTHRQLSTWFTDTLSGDDTSSKSLFHLLSSRQVHAVTKPA